MASLCDALLDRITPEKRKCGDSDQILSNKRVRAAVNCVKWKPIVAAGSTDARVFCVRVDRGNVKLPIPLWPQYEVLWRDVEFGDNRWIIVSTYEGWLMQMLNTISPKDVRRC